MCPKYKYSPQDLERMAASPWLTDRERETFTLYHQRGWAIEDVAAELHCSRSTVNRALASIRTKTL